ncbi:hypothetical protein GQX73_g4057 [Xylaria multiplex]|uniref:Uncharacterized protein n=1 Tax=Xylaria multiplex TaxID=323545 RepID=A0A7C8MZL1_9PEZI|nr:hypothetical protein GQX73_g4057 [Xylaria multiplex]
MATLNDASALAAVSAAVSATASAARNRDMEATHYSKPRSSFDAASYMNYLRAPASSRLPTNPHGVGIHIHYQGQSLAILGTVAFSNGPIARDLPIRPVGARGVIGGIFSQVTLRDTKPRAENFYYVGRVREVYDNHCEHHRLLFRDVCLLWEIPEKVTLSEEGVEPESRIPTPHSVHSSGSLSTPASLPGDLSRESGSQRTVLAEKANKGKEKGMITGVDVDAGTPVSPSISSMNLSLKSERENSVAAEHINKGKEKEVLTRIDVDADTLVESMRDDKSKEVEMEVSPTITSSKTIAKSQPKHNKTSMQQRIRQLWPTRSQEKSSEKALSV